MRKQATKQILLDIPLNEWMKKNPTTDLNQCDFVYYKISGLFAKNDVEFKKFQDSIKVISTHESGSVVLPVYRLTLDDGTVFTLRGNGYDWKVSVNSPVEIEANFLDVFKDNPRISIAYCEGFPKDSVYGVYSKDKKKFTVELMNNYLLFTFFWILTRRHVQTPYYFDNEDAFR